MTKRFGQHFLKNRAAIQRIATALELRPGETVIEIGSGHGELTKELLKYPIKLIAIEKDRLLAKQLFSSILRSWNARIVAGDVLKILPALTLNLEPKTYKLLGNIPYYITGRLLRILSELENKPSLTILTIQKEVAERLTAQPPKMNRLAAIVQFWAEPKILFHIPPQYFAPPPKVQSNVIRLKVKGEKLKVKEGDYYKLVRILFAHPRKTIANNLKPFKSKILSPKSLGLTGQERPQELDLDTLIKISDIIKE